MTLSFSRRAFLTSLPIAAGCGRLAFSAADERYDPSEPALHIGPVLQNATDGSLGVLFEADGASDEAFVDFGQTPSLGQSVRAQEKIRQPTSIMERRRTTYHTTLTGLTPDTRYYYRVRIGTTLSYTFCFRTPPERGVAKPFRFAVYSDCQQRPDVHRQIVEQGILGSLTEGRPVADELAFLLVAGDVVQDGDTYREYKERFFAPSQGVTCSAPLYACIGNHEADSEFFWNYLNLPKNGTPGYEEHWYSFDYGNVHVIALDTNKKYRTEAQLAWLEQDLAAAAADPRTSFIFAMFHHPWKSELWPQGEEAYSGEIVRRLEAALSQSGKPGAYFYGHTHGYARGQSKDAPLYWVNVGSAGGTLDRWGDYPEQRPYDEYQCSFDEYGVLLVEVNADGTPGFKATRLSFGHGEPMKPAEVQDVFGSTANAAIPAAPLVTHAALTADGAAEVRATDDRIGDAAPHLETEWEIGGESGRLASCWRRREKLYNNQNLMAGSSLTAATIPLPPEASATKVRVRFRSEDLTWSPWSEPAPLGR